MHPRAPGLLALWILGVLAAGPGRSLADGDPPPLRLDGRDVDLAHGGRPPAILAAPSDPFPDRTSLLVVQLREEPRDGLLESLRAAGIQIVQYVPEASFFARGTPAAAQHARDLSFVAWIGQFPPVLKLAPPLSRLVENL